MKFLRFEHKILDYSSDYQYDAPCLSAFGFLTLIFPAQDAPNNRSAVLLVLVMQKMYNCGYRWKGRYFLARKLECCCETRLSDQVGKEINTNMRIVLIAKKEISIIHFCNLLYWGSSWFVKPKIRKNNWGKALGFGTGRTLPTSRFSFNS